MTFSETTITVTWCPLCGAQARTNPLRGPLGSTNAASPVFACDRCFLDLNTILSTPRALRAIIGLFGEAHK